MSCSSRRRSRSSAPLAAALALVAAVALASVRADETAPKAGEEYAVVVSSDVTSAGLTSAQLRRVFLFSERYWKPGAPIRVLLSDDSLHAGSFLLERVCKMDYQAFHRYVLEKLYQQEIDLAPKIVGSDELAVNFVSNGSRLITIVRAEAARKGTARIVPIDGLLPGSPGYPLRK